MNRLLILLLLVSFLASCATPVPVSRLNPIGDSFEWQNGTERLFFSTDEGLRAEVQFVSSNSRHLVFEVKIQNRSDTSVLVNPTQFFLEPLGADTSFIMAEAIQAHDPEQELIRLDHQIASEEAFESNNRAAELLSQTANLISDVSGNSVSSEEEVERNQRRAEHETDMINSEIAQSNLKDQKLYWQSVVLRKTMLHPNYEINGAVYFPRHNQARFFKMGLAIGPVVFQAKFQQRILRN